MLIIFDNFDANKKTIADKCNRLFCFYTPQYFCKKRFKSYQLC